MPSPLPAKPRRSVVVALTLTAPDVAREVGREVRAHRRHVRRDFRRLRDQRDVEIADVKAASGGERRDVAEQHPAVGVLPARIGIGKVRSDVAQRERAEDGVAHGVQQDIGVGVAVEAALVRNDHAAQHEPAAGDERMDVEPVADAHVGHGSTTSGTSAARMRGGIGTGRSLARSTHT